MEEKEQPGTGKFLKDENCFTENDPKRADGEKSSSRSEERLDECARRTDAQ